MLVNERTSIYFTLRNLAWGNFLQSVYAVAHLRGRRGSGRHGGLMVSALDSGASGPSSSPGQGLCVVFLGKTLYSHGASLHRPGV